MQCIFFKMSLRLCVSGCGDFLSLDDGHEHCVSCLGVQHVNVVLARRVLRGGYQEGQASHPLLTVGSQ